MKPATFTCQNCQKEFTLIDYNFEVDMCDYCADNTFLTNICKNNLKELCKNNSKNLPTKKM